MQFNQYQWPQQTQETQGCGAMQGMQQGYGQMSGMQSMPMMTSMPQQTMQQSLGCPAQVVNRQFECEVPHTVNMHTHVVNNYTRRHTYYPYYTQSEETRVYDIYGNPCCGGRMF